MGGPRHLVVTEPVSPGVAIWPPRSDAEQVVRLGHDLDDWDTGVVDVQLDKATNRLATPACPDTYTAAFVAGTEPHDTCDQGGGITGFFSRIFGSNSEKVLPPPNSNQSKEQAADDDKKKKGLFGKIVGIFKDDKTQPTPSKQTGTGGNDPPPQ